MANSSTNRFENDTQLYPLPAVPLEILHADHFGPLQETEDNYKHILVVIDSFSRFTWLFPVKTTSSKEVINNLQNLFSTFGKPKEFVSDRGTAFTSHEFADFMIKFKISHRKVAVAAPWSNGMAERVNRFIKSSLTKLLNDPVDWKQQIGIMMYIINNTYHSVIKSTPAKIIFGFDQRNHSDQDLADLTKKLAQIDTDL